MANEAKFVQDGDVIDFKAVANISYMKAVPLTTTTSVALGIGVTLEDIKANTIGAVATKGVFELPSVTTAMNLGDQVYWDDTNRKITKTSTNNTPAGMVVEDKASGVTTAKVRIG